MYDASLKTAKYVQICKQVSVSGCGRPGLNPGSGEFSVPGAHPSPMQWYTVLPGDKVVRAWCQLPTPSSANVKETVEL